jgi:hypothetical protein
VQQQATIPEPNAQAEEQLRGEGFDLAGRSRGRRKERDCGQTEMGETGRRCRRRTASARRGRRVGASLACGCFQGVAAGPLEGAPEGELKREYARLAGSSSGRVGCAKNLKAVGQAAGGAGQWALVR